MLQLGSVVLAAVLLGVPRALEARAFGAQRSVYVEVAPQAPQLTDFAEELERAIGGTAYSLAAQPTEATVVVEVLNVARSTASNGGEMEAATFAIRDGRRTRPLVLHYEPGQQARAARLLLDSLPGSRG